MRRMKRRRTTNSSLRLDHKPDRQRDGSHNDDAPHHRRDVFRTPASRRVINGVVEFAIHGARLTEDCHYLVPQRRRLAGAALTGSDAGKLSTRPASSLAWISRPARAASRGLAACLSCAAGSNRSAMSHLQDEVTRRQFGRSHHGAEHRPFCLLTSRFALICRRGFAAAGIGWPTARSGIFPLHEQYCTDRRGNFGWTMPAMSLHPRRGYTVLQG
jgi:hypothetical protein